MELPDFTNLPLIELVSTFLFFAALDTGVAYVVAITNGNFTPAYALDFLRTHILKVGTPIVGLAIVEHGVSGFVPAIPGAGLAAAAALAIYALTTIVSIKDSFADKAIPPTTTTNISPVTETDG